MKNVRATFVYNDFEHLGTSYLMASLKRHGHLPAYVHYRHRDTFQFVCNPEDIQKVVDRIASTRPQVLCFSCITSNYQFQLQIAKASKERFPELKTIFGGVHVTLTAERVLRQPQVDCVVRGEGELVLVELLDNCSDDTVFWPEKAPRGVTFKNAEGQEIGCFDMAPRIVDLDNLPFPEKGLIYDCVPPFKQEYQAMASRGCAYSCSYCYAGSIPLESGIPRAIKRSPMNVIEELELAIQRFKPHSITFHDDVFTASRRWLDDFLPLYKARINLPFCCSTYPAVMDEQKAKALKDAGCIFIAIGVQSLSEEVCRDVLNRPIKRSKVKTCIDALNKAGLMCQVDHILDIPGDTQQNNEDALLFYNEVRPSRIQVFRLNYLPKAPIIQHAKQHGALTDEEIDNIEEGIDGTNFFSMYQTAHRHTRAIAFLMNWMPLLPRILLRFLVRSGIYKYIYLPGPYLNLILPRALLAIFSPDDIRGRHHIRRFFLRIFKR